MNSNNPNDDEILKAAMGDLDDAFGETPSSPSFAQPETPNPDSSDLTQQPNTHEPSMATPVKKKPVVVPIIVVVAAIAVVGGAVAVISNNHKSYVPTDSGYVDGDWDDIPAVDNPENIGDDENEAHKFEKGEVEEGGLFSNYNTITYEGVDYKANPYWNYSVSVAVNETSTNALNGGKTCIYIDNQRYNDEDGLNSVLLMYYDNTYDEVVSGNQKVYMSLIKTTNPDTDEIYTYLYDESNKVIFSFADRGNGCYYDAEDNLILSQDGFKYYDEYGNEYNKEEAWNYLVSLEPKLAYVFEMYFELS